MPSGEPDGLREAAIDWLEIRTDSGRDPLTREDLRDFHFAKSEHA